MKQFDNQPEIEDPDSTEIPPIEEIVEKDMGSVESTIARRYHHGMSKQDLLEHAAEIAVDMETGYYVDVNGKQWEPKPFNVSEILRKMQYGHWMIVSGKRPGWFPGQTNFRSYVQWKKQERLLQGRITFREIMPFLEALMGMSLSEMSRRLAVEPKTIPFRDLVTLTGRLADSFANAGSRAPLVNGEPMSDDGISVYIQIKESLKSLPEGAARERSMSLLTSQLEKVRTLLSGNPGEIQKIVDQP